MAYIADFNKHRIMLSQNRITRIVIENIGVMKNDELPEKILNVHHIISYKHLCVLYSRKKKLSINVI
jgi:hypothetical protein